MEDRRRSRGVKTLSRSIKGGAIAALPGPRPVECQWQPEELRLCQSLHSALLSN